MFIEQNNPFIQTQEVTTSQILWDLMDNLSPKNFLALKPEESDNLSLTIRYIECVINKIYDDNAEHLNNVDENRITSEHMSCVNRQLNPQMVLSLVEITEPLVNGFRVNSAELRTRLKNYIFEWQEHTGIRVDDLNDHDAGLLKHT